MIYTIVTNISLSSFIWHQLYDVLATHGQHGPFQIVIQKPE